MLVGSAGVGPQGTPVKLPELNSRLSQMEQSVGLLLSGGPLPVDVQRADACTKVHNTLCTVPGAKGFYNKYLLSLHAFRQGHCPKSVSARHVEVNLKSLNLRVAQGSTQSHLA